MPEFSVRAAPTASGLICQTYTFAPTSSNALAIVAPIPAAPPVTRTFRPGEGFKRSKVLMLVQCLASGKEQSEGIGRYNSQVPRPRALARAPRLLPPRVQRVPI